MTPQPDYRIHAGPTGPQKVPDVIKSDLGGQAEPASFGSTDPRRAKQHPVAAGEAATKSEPGLSNRTQSARDRVARYPQILGGTANGPQHAFVGDLSEPWAGESASDIRKRAAAPTGAKTPSIRSTAPSPSLPLVHCGKEAASRAWPPSPDTSAAKLHRPLGSVKPLVPSDREHHARGVTRDGDQDLLLRLLRVQRERVQVALAVEPIRGHVAHREHVHLPAELRPAPLAELWPAPLDTALLDDERAPAHPERLPARVVRQRVASPHQSIASLP